VEFPQIEMGELPNVEFPQIEMGELPNVEFPQIEMGELPNVEFPQIEIGELPELSDNLDIDTISGLSNDSNAIYNQNTINSSDTNRTVNNQTTISLGGITVQNTGNSNNNSSQPNDARQIARDIARELEPIFEQASRELNSGVEL
jgi:hypothetical protein